MQRVRPDWGPADDPFGWGCSARQVAATPARVAAKLGGMLAAAAAPRRGRRRPRADAGPHSLCCPRSSRPCNHKRHDVVRRHRHTLLCATRTPGRRCHCHRRRLEPCRQDCRRCRGCSGGTGRCSRCVRLDWVGSGKVAAASMSGALHSPYASCPAHTELALSLPGKELAGPHTTSLLWLPSTPLSMQPRPGYLCAGGGGGGRRQRNWRLPQLSARPARSGGLRSGEARVALAPCPPHHRWSMLMKSAMRRLQAMLALLLLLLLTLPRHQVLPTLPTLPKMRRRHAPPCRQRRRRVPCALGSRTSQM